MAPQQRRALLAANVIGRRAQAAGVQDSVLGLFRFHTAPSNVIGVVFIPIEQGSALIPDSIYHRSNAGPGGPEASVLEGDETRTVHQSVGPGHARIIGLDDLYLERLRQATIDEASEGVEFHSALAVAAARFEDIDWKYVANRLVDIQQREGDRVGGGMKRISARIRRRVLRAIREG